MVAVVFPGQGSQKPGMGRELEASQPAARAVFDAVGEAIGMDVRGLCFESDEETLRRTQNAQIALFTCGVAAWRAFHEKLPVDAVFAGHSVGEYAALVASGTLALEDGARLVQRRGELMAQSGTKRPGTMAAVLGLDRDALERVCAETSLGEGVVVVANDNCPGQLVISGDVGAVQRASIAASEAGAKRVLPLNVSGAFHSPLMEESAAEMGVALRNVAFHAGRTVVANVSAAPETDPATWPSLLEEQLKRPVRWTETVGTLREAGVSRMVECGVGEVLCGLAKRIDRELPCWAVYDDESLARTVAEVGGNA